MERGRDWLAVLAVFLGSIPSVTGGSRCRGRGNYLHLYYTKIGKRIIQKCFIIVCIGVSCGRGYWFGNWPCVAVTGLVHSLGGLPVFASVVIGSEGWKEQGATCGGSVDVIPSVHFLTGSLGVDVGQLWPRWS